MLTNIATFLHFHELSVEIVRHYNLSVHVQGWNALCENSGFQFGLYDGHHLRFLSASAC
jgi:hypothetical protein